MSNRKLLLADDSITIQKVVNLTFADEGIDVIAVGDGNSAMDKLREDMPDLVMADVNMPGLNGYEICEKIKTSESKDSDIPVILLVGSFEPFDEDEANRVGADDYLTKPFQSISQLVDKVTELLKIEDENSLEDTAEMFLDDEETTSIEDVMTANFNNEVSSMPTLSDDFVDDEMIQTAQVGSVPIDDSVKFDSTTEIPTLESENPFKDDTTDVVEPDFHKTQPLTDADYRELAIEESIESNDSKGIQNDLELTDEVADETGFEITQMHVSESIEEEPVNLETPRTFEHKVQFNKPVEEEPKLQLDDTVTSEQEPPTIGSKTTETEVEPESSTLKSEVRTEDSNTVDLEEKVDESVPTKREVENQSREIEQPVLETANQTPLFETSNQEEEFELDFSDDQADLPMPEAASILELDELNLLDLPPLDLFDDDNPKTTKSYVENDIEESKEEVEETESVENAEDVDYSVDENFENDTVNSEVEEIETEIVDSEPEKIEADTEILDAETSQSVVEETVETIPETSEEKEDIIEEISTTSDLQNNEYDTEVTTTADLNDKKQVYEAISDSEFSEIANEMDEDISAETVKVVAEKIVERISKKEVREIAWEVVPELAELIIKKMAKEKIKD